MSLGIIKLTTEQLVFSGMHLGHNKWLLNSKIKPYLLGYKNSLNIINLYFTLLQMKTFLQFLFNIVSLRQKILIVKESSIFDLKKIFLFSFPVVFYEEKWIGGFLTNFKAVRKCNKLKSMQNSIQLLQFFPSVILLYNSSSSKWVLHESLNLEIPLFSVLDTKSSFFDLINYPIIGNNKSFECLYFYSYLFKNVILKGMQKECLSILRII